MSATSKILQFVEIVKAKDSSAISPITWFISAFTNLSKFIDDARNRNLTHFAFLLARIYTIYIDSADTMLLTNFIVSTFLSSMVYAAVLYYKKPKESRKEA